MENSVDLTKQLRILNIAFYKFVSLDDLVQLRRNLREKCEEFQILGTILVSPEGINGGLAGKENQIREFQQFFRQLKCGAEVEFKESYSDYVPFKKLFVKIKKEIIPAGDPNIQPEIFTGARISPLELKKWLDEDREFDLLDTRNDYEVEYGTFDKSVHLGLQHFRDFSKKLISFKKDSEKPLVMFCTGGVRCEKASVVALRQGFREVYQLDGGILQYFKVCGESHYRGSCFVFDERVALNSQLISTKLT